MIDELEKLESNIVASHGDQPIKIGVIGLGYVGLPVAISLSRAFPTIGFDVDERRVSTLRQGLDWTEEFTSEDLQKADIEYFSEIAELKSCNFFVVAVPTPVTSGNSPDFSMLESACKLIGPAISPGAIIVFESTVFPGATEDICGPALEAATGLTCGVDFKLGYSPERINPGDKERQLENIVKIVSAQDAESLEVVASVYEKIIDAGVHRASSIKVAEAAKVLENTQRDINIALMNEMAKICSLIGIRTADVLEAAGTKWNFLRFTPGLVGGHCIGVDPYYLTAKAEELGYHPEVILAGRRINDSMPAYMAGQIIRQLATKGVSIPSARVGILGITFKEGVPDIRNSKVADLYQSLCEFGIKPRVADPRADADETQHEYGITLEDSDNWTGFDVLIVAVSHPEYCENLNDRVDRALRQGGIVVDVKSIITQADIRPDLTYISL